MDETSLFMKMVVKMTMMMVMMKTMWELGLGLLYINYLADILVPFFHFPCGFYFFFYFQSSIECYNLHLWSLLMITVRIFDSDKMN